MNDSDAELTNALEFPLARLLLLILAVPASVISPSKRILPVASMKDVFVMLLSLALLVLIHCTGAVSRLFTNAFPLALLMNIP